MNNQTIKNAFAKSLNNMLDEDFFRWPPICSGIAAQPERPYAKQSDTKIHEEK